MYTLPHSEKVLDLLTESYDRQVNRYLYNLGQMEYLERPARGTPLRFARYAYMAIPAWVANALWSYSRTIVMRLYRMSNKPGGDSWQA